MTLGRDDLQLLALASDETATAVPADRQPLAEPADPEQRSQAAKLVELAERVELFHTPTDEPFATLPVGGHHETHPVRSLTFKSWLRRQYWDTYRKPAGGSALLDAVETLAARAEFGGETHSVATRVAEQAGCIYVDLTNDAWEAVEIGPAGWRVVTSPPVRFRRSGTMEALPVPVRGGSLELLRPFVNVADADSWHLFVGTLVAALRPRGPYLVLIMHGEQGSAKSTTARVVRALVDPSRSPLRAEPREQQDLLIAARNNWVVAFDNVSHLPPWLSDALCRLSTGGGFGTRQLYTDQDEIVLDAQRPQVLNGISEIATRGDLLDRAIILEQPTIDDAERRSEDEFWQSFEAVRPRILGALFDAVSAALANEPHIALDRLPRMADPARWVTAAEAALGWRPETFVAAYARNRREGHALALEASLLTTPLQVLVSTGDWQGPARVLLERLAGLAGDGVTRQREWPRNPRALTAALKRLAPSLRAMGIGWERLERTGNARPHLIRATGGTTVTSVTSVTASADSGGARTPDPEVDRHLVARTVTPGRAPDDGHDGHDGATPSVPCPDVVTGAPVPHDVPLEEQMTWTA